MPGEFSGKRIIVMGLGRFGGGIGVTRWLCAQGARVLVTDLAGEEKLAESLRELDGLELSRRLGGHDEADLDGCELLVVSPAVDKAKSAFFRAAVARGIPCTSEMNLFLERCRGRVIGITGTVGKSTTTAMIGAVLERARSASSWVHGNVWLGGNIGKSLLDDLPSIGERDVVVLELSSFQLEDAGQIRRSPHISVITNLRDNHLDRHGTMEAYSAAKANIYRHQRPQDWLLLPLDEDLTLFPDLGASGQQIGWYGVDRAARRVLLSTSADRQPTETPATAGARGGCRIATPVEPEAIDVTLAIPGLHNLMNAAAAISVSRILGVEDDVARAALATFAGLPHRLEFVGERGGVRYYNDSKATTPEAAMTSLAAFDPRTVVLIVGGSDKGSDFTALGRAIAERAKAGVCIGETAGAIFSAIRMAMRAPMTPAGERSAARPEGRCSSGDTPSRGCDTSETHVQVATDFASAVTVARRLAQSGDVVLLSPACASYDWFRNYEDRGDQFRQLVHS